MIFKQINLRSATKENVETEIMYEIAAARADGSELIRINFSESLDDQGTGQRKLESAAVRLLKNMKLKGQIQFYASAESFDKMSTEAVFLINKYPSILDKIPSEDNSRSFIFIKL